MFDDVRVRRPASRPDRAGVLHLGLGSFHRAHQAVYTAAALDARPGPWGIIGVASRSRGVVEGLRRQGGRYSVLTLDADSAAADVLDVHLDAYTAADEPARLRAHLAGDDVRVVTLTVTENGYTYSHARGGLDLDSPQVQADLMAQWPGSAVGQLARGLAARFRAGGAPLAVVSCDNVSDNGRLLRQLVTEFVQESADSDADAVLAWLDDCVGFPSTMVDRIVPATEDRHRDLSRQLTGTRDEVPVPAESFSMWVLQDRFPAGRPAWEAGGALFTDRVRDYELVKLRVLNASHSLLAYLGLLSGEPFIATSVQNPRIARAVEHLIRAEMLPTLTVPEAIDIDVYVGQLFGRFANLAVGHRTSQVGSDGSTKLPVRADEPVLHHHRRGHAPGATALLVAAYLRSFCDAGAVPPQVGTPQDPRAAELAELGRRHGGAADLVRAVVVDSGIFPAALADATAWLDRVADLLTVLRADGVEGAVDAALE
jgi:fructuronate reductase